MKLFSSAEIAQIQQVAEKSKSLSEPVKAVNSKSITDDVKSMSEKVKEYFKDSKAILITSKDQLHDYVTKFIEAGIGGIDTETTGLDRVKDHIVGSSLYYPGGVECYIPNKHLIPIFDQPYNNQLTYDEVREEFQRFVDAGTKLIFANADFDLAMIYKDYKVDLIPSCYYDVILAWRCLKENEKDNTLKGLYNKYCLKGKGDPMMFSDFFTPTLFPYCNPEVAKLYAANDALITYLLYKFELPFATKSNLKCINNKLEGIADLIWNVEFPLMSVCQQMHRQGVYIDKSTSNRLIEKYQKLMQHEESVLADMVDAELAKADYATLSKKPFANGSAFNAKSTVHVKYLVYTLMKVPQGRSGGTGKEVLNELNLPITNQILKVRSLNVLMSTFVKKMPNATTPDSRIHANFKQIGADTGRFSSAEPNLQNIPSHVEDIRHMFRATASHTEMIDCSANDGVVSFSVPYLNKLKTPDGYVKVKDIKESDPIILVHNGKEETLYVRHMESSDEDTRICNVVVGLQSTRTEADSVC